MNPAFTPESALFGHVSPETAFVVTDYPYGFKLRTTIRYWIETDARHGDRFVSQTMNPKVAGEVWNKPKKSTYGPVMVMFLDDLGHVTYASLSTWADAPFLQHFTLVAGDQLNPHQANQLRISILGHKINARHQAAREAREAAEALSS